MQEEKPPDSDAVCLHSITDEKRNFHLERQSKPQAEAEAEESVRISSGKEKKLPAMLAGA